MEISDNRIEIVENSDNEKNDKIIRLIKSVSVNEGSSSYLDNSVIKFKYYNSFNYSLLSRDNHDINFTVGITSPQKGDGKTLIASNMAVSFALGTQKSTILVDLNIANPRLHKIFGVPLSPGLTEALNDSNITVSRTAIENLSVLTAGKKVILHEKLFPKTSADGTRPQSIQPSLGLEQLASFRDVLYSLEQKYEIIIVDMPAINSPTIPLLYINQLQGLIVVIQTEKTKKEDLDKLLQRVNERNVLGFVLNRFSTKD